MKGLEAGSETASESTQAARVMRGQSEWVTCLDFVSPARKQRDREEYVAHVVLTGVIKMSEYLLLFVCLFLE